MTLIIQNADNKLVDMINAINSISKKTYKYIKEDEYPESLVKSIKEGEEEFIAQSKNHTLETFNSAEEAFSSLI